MTATGNVLNGRFRLDQLIGRGAFAQVYLSTDLVLQRQVAVKVLHPDRLAFDDQVDFQARFANEARLIAGMEHPHILGLYDYGQADQSVYLVMPYVDGGSLHQALQRVGRFTPVQAGEYLRQVAGALDYAHRRGIVHRDIKPQNMLLREEDNHVLLADFGIAKVLGADTSQSGTGIIGSPAYMAPEQFQGRVGRAADFYALACVVFELLTGKPPYPGTLEQTMFGHVWGPVPPLTDYLPELESAPLQAFFNRALAKSPESRFATAKALSDAYQEALRGTIIPMDSPPLVGTVRAGAGTAAPVVSNGLPVAQSQAMIGVVQTGNVQSTSQPYPLAGAAASQISQPLAAAPIASSTGDRAAASTPPRRQQSLLIALLGVIAILVLVAGGLMIARSRQQTDAPSTRTAAQAAEVPTPTILAAVVPTAVPIVAPTPTALSPTATATAAPTLTPTPVPTPTATVVPTVAPTPTPVPPPPIGVFGFGTVAQGDLEAVAPEDVVETFIAGQEIFVFINFAGAQPNQDKFDLTLVVNGSPQPPQSVLLTKDSGFVLVSLGAIPIGSYRVELSRNGAPQQAPWVFNVVAPAPVPTPVPSTAPAEPTPTPRPVTVPTPTPVPVVVPTPTPVPVVVPTPTPRPVTVPTPTPVPSGPGTRPTPLPGG